MSGDSADAEAVERTLTTAMEVLRVHVADADGWCMGCLALWGRLVLVEQCTQLAWATAVREAYGWPAD